MIFKSVTKLSITTLGFYIEIKGEITMKKTLTTMFLAAVLLITALPAYANAEKCTEHQWSEWKTAYKATCIYDGSEYRECAICHNEEWRKILATGHQWGEWEVAREATCGEIGSEGRQCAICTKIEWQEIPATGEHQWEEWEIDYKPTCTDAGLKDRECTICYEEEQQEIPATGKHSWGGWEITKRTTVFSEGNKSRYCNNCNAVEQKTIPKLKAKITLEEKSATLESGKSHKIKIKSKTYGDKVKKWTSSNKKVATVDSRGKITGKQSGTATITLKMKSGVQATCKINVTKPKYSTNSKPSTSYSGGSGSHSSGSNTTTPSSGYVWIPNTGSKYHKTSTCSGMKDPSKVTVEEAKSYGYTPCSKCY